MKTLHIAIFSLICITVIVLSSSQAYAVPYVFPPAKYFNSDIVLIGKVISSSSFSPTYTKYEIKVEQYLKNPQSQDTLNVIAQGTNKTGMTADTVFDVGQQAFLYLKKDQANYTAWWYSYPTDSLCDPAPTATDLNFTYPQDAGLDYNPLQVGASKSSSYLYAANQPVVVKYDAWNNQFITKTFDVVFQVKNQTGQIIFNDTKQVELKACIGHQIVNSTFIPRAAGTYEIDVIFNNSLTGTTVEIPPSVVSTVSDITHTSPLQQFKSGTLAQDVKCGQGLQLVIKSTDKSPACLRPDTAYQLIYRGWAKEFVQSVLDKSQSSACEEMPVPSGDHRTNIFPVLIMSPNSTAIVCVTYNFEYDWNSYPNKDVYPHGILETCCFVDIGDSSTSESTRQFDILANPPLFNVTGVNNGSKVTVMYKIHAGLGSKGFYDTSIPFDNCDSYPLAVGYGPSDVDATKFHANFDIPCFNTIENVDSVNIVSGMTYKVVQFP